MIKNIYSHKIELYYAVILWAIGAYGLSALLAGLVLFDVKLIIFGMSAIFILRRDVLYFSRNHRVFFLTLLFQVICNSVFIVLGLYYFIVEIMLCSILANLIWCFSFSFYFFKKLDWNE